MSQLLKLSALYSVLMLAACNAGFTGNGGKANKDGGDAKPTTGPTGGPGGKIEVNCTDLNKADCDKKIDEQKKANPGKEVTPYREVNCPTATKEDPKCQALIKKQQDLDGGAGTPIRTKSCADDPNIAGCVIGGGGATILDFKACANASGLGLHDGYGKCGANEVMTFINDGSDKQFTCCPLTAGDVLSSNAGERYMERSACGIDEVGVGMKSLSTAYCTKLNTAVYGTGTVGTSVLVYPTTSWLDPAQRALAGAYNAGDTCTCRDASVISGNHSSSNGNCTDRCVQIIKK